MKREVVQDFLNLPGIAGLALVDGRSRPYFCGVDHSLNFQQKEALSQGIQQVIETTPADFEFFEFQFSGYQVYIYKLTHGIILLVLTAHGELTSSYAEMVEVLKNELQQEAGNAIPTFRLLAGTISLSGQNYWQKTDSSPEAVCILPVVDEESPTTPASPTAAQPTSIPSIPLKDILTAMNHLSKYAAQYLGPVVVANNWRSTRPDQEWLGHFQVDRLAQITYVAQLSSLTHEQHQQLKGWVAAFVDRCSKVIRHFSRSVRQADLDDRQQFLLFSDSGSD